MWGEKTLTRGGMPMRICPHFYGGTDVRLDSFMVGKAIYVQLDMPLKPLWADFLRSGCNHGLLQIRRINGEATVPFKAMAQLISSTKTKGLKVACLGTAEIFGISMTPGGPGTKRDLLLPDEELIWEWKLHETGHFTDPFDYTSLLAISDSRLHIARARCPKPLSLRGLFLGPRTFGFPPYDPPPGREDLNDRGGRPPTEATTRSRAPPFWPGLGPPIDGFGFVFMPKFSQMYLAALSVTQKPYGLSRHATVAEPRTCLVADPRGYLRVSLGYPPMAGGPTLPTPRLHTIPKGARIVAVVDPEGEEIDLDDSCWASESELELGSKVLLEAVDHQWNTMSDEPWVPQLRSIMDIILGKEVMSGANDKVIWDVLEEPEREEPSCLARLGATVFGHEMMGLHSTVAAIARHSRLGDEKWMSFDSNNTYDKMLTLSAIYARRGFQLCGCILPNPNESLSQNALAFLRSDYPSHLELRQYLGNFSAHRNLPVFTISKNGINAEMGRPLPRTQTSADHLAPGHYPVERDFPTTARRYEEIPSGWLTRSARVKHVFMPFEDRDKIWQRNLPGVKNPGPGHYYHHGLSYEQGLRSSEHTTPEWSIKASKDGSSCQKVGAWILPAAWRSDA
eukprot:g33177.t1